MIFKTATSKIFVLFFLCAIGSTARVNAEILESQSRDISPPSEVPISHRCQQNAWGTSCSTKVYQASSSTVEEGQNESDLEVEGEEYVILDQPITALEEEGGDDTKEDSLTPALPPSSRRRRWGLALGSVALLSIGGLLWAYRRSLPLHRVPRLPRLSLPTISSSTFDTIKPTSIRPGGFRPAPSSLLRWSDEEDPMNTRPTSSWKSKFTRTSKPGRSTRSRFGGLLSGDSFEEGGYEEVGLLPSTNLQLSLPSATTNYGTV